MNHTTLRLAVVSTGRTADRARSKNAERTTALIARLRDLLGQNANIRTVDYTSSKNRLDGYVANNTIVVQVQDPAMAGKVIDVAARAGATVTGGIEPLAADSQKARAEALKQATVRARADGEAIAAAFGLRVVRVLAAETVASPVAGSAVMGGPEMLARRVVVPTPMEAGAAELRVQVSVTLEVAP